MTVILQCGHCGHAYTIDANRAKTADFGNYCPNCEACMPNVFKNLVYSVTTMNERPECDAWKLCVLPTEISITTAPLTFPLK